MKNLVWKIWGGKLDKTQDKVKWHTIMLMVCQNELGIIDFQKKRWTKEVLLVKFIIQGLITKKRR